MSWSRLLDNENKPLLLDVRSRAARADGIIPGAIPAHPTEMHPTLAHYDRNAEIVVYCACPNEATAAVAAKHLKAAGFKKIRPLLGGHRSLGQSRAQAGHRRGSRIGHGGLTDCRGRRPQPQNCNTKRL